MGERVLVYRSGIHGLPVVQHRHQLHPRAIKSGGAFGIYTVNICKEKFIFGKLPASENQTELL